MSGLHIDIKQTGLQLSVESLIKVKSLKTKTIINSNFSFGGKWLQKQDLNVKFYVNWYNV